MLAWEDADSSVHSMGMSSASIAPAPGPGPAAAAAAFHWTVGKVRGVGM